MIAIVNELMFVAVALGLLMLVCIVRIVLGPTAADRTVALDTVNTLVMAALVVLGAAFGQVIFIDVAIVYALLSFVTTLFISKQVEAVA